MLELLLELLLFRHCRARYEQLQTTENDGDKLYQKPTDGKNVGLVWLKKKKEVKNPHHTPTPPKIVVFTSLPFPSVRGMATATHRLSLGPQFTILGPGNRARNS